MIQRIFIYLILAIIIPDIYIYRAYIVRLTTKKILRYTYFIPSFLLLIGLTYIAIAADSKFISDNSQYIGWMTIASFLVVIPKILFAALSLLDIPLRYIVSKKFQPFKYIGLLSGLASFILIIYGVAIGKTAFVVNEVPIYSSNIPTAFNGYRIVQLSDIHIGSWKGNNEKLKKAIKMVNNQHPDLVVFTGDLVNSKADELNGFEEILSGIKSKDGIYSILGNHDYGTYYQWDNEKELTANLEDLKSRQEKMGWKMLNNDHVIIHKDKDSIALIGVENEGEPPFSQHGDLKNAMRDANAGYKILLSHNPTHWKREVLSTDIDLMLAGHTHAMQLAWGQHSPSSYVYPEWKGIYKHEKDNKTQLLYVNIGLGFIGMPLRIGAWPEITVFTLYSKP